MGNSATSGTMRAAVRTSSGIEFREDYPSAIDAKLKRGEVLVRVRAAAINPVDYKVGKMILGPVAGLDLAGEVVRVSEGSTTLKVGDSVFGTARGSLADYVIAKETYLARKPDSLSFEKAAAMPTVYLTGLQGLQRGKIDTLDSSAARVLIIGASGGCGTAAVQLAAHGFKAGFVCGICSGKNAEYVRSNGAHEVLDYREENFFQNAHFSQSEDEKFDIIYDAATNSGKGEDYKSWSLDRLKSNGQYVAINGSAWMWMRLLTGIGQKRNQHLFVTNANTRDLETLGEYASEDVVSPVIMQTLPFSAEGVQDAFSLLKSRRVVGKLVFTVNEAAQ